MDIEILKIDQIAFKPFGEILEPSEELNPEVSEDGVFKFYVTFKEEARGWQIGFLDQIGKKVEKLECHPNTSEVFVPLSGDAVLILSIDPKNTISAFRLEKPIVLYKKVWHGIISLTDRSRMLIVENPDVIDEYYQLNVPINNNNLI